ncbi:MAG: hypothetical protein HYR85_24075 [Planctomycetes bacterium]|nr:hypothetical protein [Planctomycetota bacterium]MBI3846400.1 hypothetical protein [Planctomycetota bacterium]
MHYRIDGNRLVARQSTFVPIEFLSWPCLRIGALGKGQIQIRDANRIEFVTRESRRQWMLELCDTLLAFYPKGLRKIRERIDRFSRMREQWLRRTDAAKS